MKKLEPIKPWFIEEPTAPDDAVGHAEIRKALRPYGIGVATGEHAHNRVGLLAVRNRAEQLARLLNRSTDDVQTIIETRRDRCLSNRLM